MDIDLVDVIASITTTMPCYMRPYPCGKKEMASQATCDRHWYMILRNMKIEDWDQVSYKLLEKFGRKKEESCSIETEILQER